MHHPPTPPGLLHVPRVPRCPHSRQGTGGHVLRCSLTRKALPSLSSHLPSDQQGAAADTTRGSDTRAAGRHPVSAHITRAPLSPATSSRRGELRQTAECRAVRGAAHSAAAVPAAPSRCALCPPVPVLPTQPPPSPTAACTPCTAPSTAPWSCPRPAAPRSAPTVSHRSLLPSRGGSGAQREPSAGPTSPAVPSLPAAVPHGDSLVSPN